MSRGKISAFPKDPEDAEVGVGEWGMCFQLRGNEWFPVPAPCEHSTPSHDFASDCFSLWIQLGLQPLPCHFPKPSIAKLWKIGESKGASVGWLFLRSHCLHSVTHLCSTKIISISSLSAVSCGGLSSTPLRDGI